VRIIYPVLNLDWVILIRVCDMALFAATVWALALVALALDEANVVAVEASAPAAGLCDGNYVFTTLHPPNTNVPHGVLRRMGAHYSSEPCGRRAAADCLCVQAMMTTLVLIILGLMAVLQALVCVRAQRGLLMRGWGWHDVASRVVGERRAAAEIASGGLQEE
jgi:hypothetical protein